ncbi:MAG: hypothetical protein ABIM74_00775 [candidate division WOR-3 bacterium]
MVSWERNISSSALSMSLQVYHEVHRIHVSPEEALLTSDFASHHARLEGEYSIA